jgi:hypothetical protein
VDVSTEELVRLRPLVGDSVMDDSMVLAAVTFETVYTYLNLKCALLTLVGRANILVHKHTTCDSA